MKNILVTILVAILVSFGTYKIASKDMHTEKKTESAYNRVLRTGTIRCGYAMWPPAMLVKDANTGKLSGAMVDIMETAAKNMNLKVTWTEETGWGSWIEGLKSDRFDVFCAGAYQKASRGREVRFLAPFFYNPVYAYVRPDENRIKPDLSNLNDPMFKASTMDGEISAQIPTTFFPKLQNVSLPQLASFDQLLLNVSSKKADIVFTEPSLMDDFMKKNPGSLKPLSDKPFQVFATSVAVGINQDELAQMMNSALLEMQNAGVIDQILDKDGADAKSFLHVAKPYVEAK